MRGLVAALVWCAAVCTATDVAVQADTLELLEPKLGGVALQLKELEAMKERGTLNDMTFAHAVHETTVLGPLTASLAAMGVLHDKGQQSDEELAFAKSVAFARYDRDDKGQVLLPGDSNPSSTKPANVKLATADDKRREAEAAAEKRREATKLAMAAAEEKAKAEEQRRAAEKARRDEERAAKKAAEAAVFERKAAEAAAAAAAADAAADAEAAAALRKAEQGRVEEAEKIAAEAQAYADEAKRAGNAEAAAEAETIAQEARAAVAEAREAALRSRRASCSTRNPRRRSRSWSRPADEDEPPPPRRSWPRPRRKRPPSTRRRRRKRRTSPRAKRRPRPRSSRSRKQARSGARRDVRGLAPDRTVHARRASRIPLGPVLRRRRARGRVRLLPMWRRPGREVGLRPRLLQVPGDVRRAPGLHEGRRRLRGLAADGRLLAARPARGRERPGLW